MPFKKQNYFRLEVIEKGWDITHDEVMYAVENGMLPVCVWLPICFVERGRANGSEFTILSRDHCEGLVRLRPKDCHMLFQRGRITLSHFLPTRDRDYSDIRIAPEPSQPPLEVCVRDLLVINEHRSVFDAEHDIRNDDALPLFDPPKLDSQPLNGKHGRSRPSRFKHSNHYRHIVCCEEDFHLGNIQAKVVERLHDAFEKGEPWVYGKVILHDVGSQCHRMRDVFKSQPQWRDLIESDGKGHYRLRAA